MLSASQYTKVPLPKIIVRGRDLAAEHKEYDDEEAEWFDTINSAQLVDDDDYYVETELPGSTSGGDASTPPDLSSSMETPSLRWTRPSGANRHSWQNSSTYPRDNGDDFEYPEGVMFRDWPKLSSIALICNELVPVLAPLGRAFCERHPDSLARRELYGNPSNEWHLLWNKVSGYFDALQNLFMIHPSQNLIDAADFIDQMAFDMRVIPVSMWDCRPPVYWARPDAEDRRDFMQHDQWPEDNFSTAEFPVGHPGRIFSTKSAIRLIETYCVPLLKPYEKSARTEQDLKPIIDLFKQLRDVFMLHRSENIVQAADYVAQGLVTCETHTEEGDLWDMFPADPADDMV